MSSSDFLGSSSIDPGSEEGSSTDSNTETFELQLVAELGRELGRELPVSVDKSSLLKTLPLVFNMAQSSTSANAPALITQIFSSVGRSFLPAGFIARIALPRRDAMLRLRCLGCGLSAQAQAGAWRI